MSGLVQGVYYRQFTLTKAKALGLTGWVKNLFDGKVEIICEGEKGLILDFIKELRIGPSSASVTAVQIDWQEYKREFEEFNIKF